MTPDELNQLIDKGASIDEIGAALDSTTAEARRDAVTSLDRARQRALFERCDPTAPLDRGYYVPDGITPLTPVAHHGANTLPLPGFGRRFTKWMTRDEQGVIGGYNGSPFKPFIGPGFFVMRETVGDERERGPMVVDYYMVPNEAPADWPRIRPNWLGLQVFVYHQTHDYMRRVSDHVSIGAAYKWGKVPLNSWFTLCREDAPRTAA